MTGLATPLDHFNRFNRREQLDSQFTEDIKQVIQGGYGARSDNVGVSSGRARGVRARSRGSGCPFDDHGAFVRRDEGSLAAVEEPSRLLPAAAPTEQREAFQQARSVGKRNREQQ